MLCPMTQVYDNNNINHTYTYNNNNDNNNNSLRSSIYYV